MPEAQPDKDLGGNPGSREPDPSSTGSGPPGFDLGREQLIHRVIMAISSASVPHEHPIPGALSSRSLGYYLGVGIDSFRHDFERHETLLRRAAEQAIEAIRHAEKAEA